jgi:hypothetical protein
VVLKIKASAFWGIYEMDFPEGSNVKAPRGLLFLFGACFFSTRGTVLFAEVRVTFA